MISRKDETEGVKPLSLIPILFLLVYFILKMAYYPEEFNHDKMSYLNMFEFIDTYVYGFKDPGWIYYVKLFKDYVTDISDMFFLLTSFLYCSFYLLTARKVFGYEHIAYFLILTFGCMGFVNYGVNVLRGGLSISIMIYCVVEKRWWVRIPLFIVAMSFQQFSAIVFVSFLVANLLKNNRAYEFVWLLCLAASFLNIIDLSGLVGDLGVEDQRVVGYTGEHENSSYEIGFRYDFLFYSLLPIAISNYYIRILEIKDDFYDVLYRTYLTANGAWLFFMRIPYTDRVAYLSWCLIPLLVLYPVLNHTDNIENPQKKLTYTMLLFMCFSIALSLRSFVKGFEI